MLNINFFINYLLTKYALLLKEKQNYIITNLSMKICNYIKILQLCYINLLYLES